MHTPYRYIHWPTTRLPYVRATDEPTRSLYLFEIFGERFEEGEVITSGLGESLSKPRWVVWSDIGEVI